MALKSVAIDTNIAIEILNGNDQTVKLLSGFDVIALPVTVCGELIYGAQNSQKARQNLSKYLSFIDHCLILDIRMPTASEYAGIKHHLKEKGRPIPENDIWIAAICRSYGIPLLTRDQHFSYIEMLQTIRIHQNSRS